MKALAQLIGAVFMALVPLLAGARLATSEWLSIGAVAAGAITVYIASNEAGTVWEYSKMFMSMVSVAGVVMISAVTDGRIATSELFQIAVALLTVLAVWWAPGTSIAAEPPPPPKVGRHRPPDDPVDQSWPLRSRHEPPS